MSARGGKTTPVKPADSGTQHISLLRLVAFPSVLVGVLCAFLICDGLMAFPVLLAELPYERTHIESEYTPKTLSVPGFENFLTFLWHKEKKIPISPWHDVPLRSAIPDTFNIIVEVPRHSHAKLEIQPFVLMNPIVQDRHKDGRLRFVKDAYPINYGAFPQTLENPFKPDPWTNIVGDKDPLDVCEIGSGVYTSGDVVPVKVLGVLGLLGKDANETDWKVIVVDVRDPLGKSWKDFEDIPEATQLAITQFFTYYKVPDGEKPSKFAMDGKILDKAFALQVIEDKHKEWSSLVSSETDLVYEGSPYQTKCTVCPLAGKKNEFAVQDAQLWAKNAFNSFLFEE